jgi:hypothetical protein
MFIRTMRLRPLACLLAVTSLSAQIIEFDSNGLHYKTLTKGGVTVMFAYLPAHLKQYSVMQVSVSNGSPIAWMVKPEDFIYRRQDGTETRASPAVAVVVSLLQRGSHHDVVKLVTTYEASLYGNAEMNSTNGYEKRREAALAEGVSAKLKAGAAASAIALVPTKLTAGESTDGALFLPNGGKYFGPGTLLVHTGGEIFEFPTEGEPVPGK